jgi:hypothetical protein
MADEHVEPADRGKSLAGWMAGIWRQAGQVSFSEDEKLDRFLKGTTE